MLHLDVSLIFIFFMIGATSPLSFNMSSISFSDSSQFNITGDASISDEGIQLTPNELDSLSSSGQKAGRAIYSQPLHLWDGDSRNLTDFYTHFTILIDSNGTSPPYYGHGLTFFLAPLGSSIPSGSRGGGLGLGVGSTPVNSSSPGSFVAVEFDTFVNPDFDPPYAPHVGIDINSMKSVITVNWDNNISYGVTNDVWISYTANSMMLRADFTSHSSNGTQAGSLSYKVDMRDFLPEYVAFGFSAATGVLEIEKHNIKSWEFSSILQYNPKKKMNKVLKSLLYFLPLWVAVLAACVGFLVVLLSVTGMAFLWVWNMFTALLSVTGKAFNKVWSMFMALLSVTGEAYSLLWNKCISSLTGDSSMDEEFILGSGPRKISYDKIVRATNNFKEKLGEGGSGKVYKGVLSEKNEYIAVKRISKKSEQGKKVYEAEVKVISQLTHVNLVQLIGWCHQRHELLLVYELMPNGSLDSHLFRETPTLTWEMRYKIALGVAKALLYLHEEFKKQYHVLHRDINSSNIMLDPEFSAKLGDFGVSRFVDRDKDLKTTTPMGTEGYLAPEVYSGEKAGKASDVYSFGIVLLEIACGRASIEEEQEQLVVWVRGLHEAGQLLDAADTKLGPLSDSDTPRVQQLLLVGLKCADHDARVRPTIGDVVQDLSSVIS